MEQEKEPKKRGQGFEKDEQPLPHRGKSYFLGIGIDEYEYKHQFQPLYNAAFDVKTIGNILVKAFEFEKPQFLINDNATRANVFNALFSYAENLGVQDKLLIYFAGHGGKVKSPNNYPYWACHDSNRDDPSSLLGNLQVKKLMDDCAAKHIFLISDSCYSGTFLKVTRSSESHPLINRELADEYEKKSSRWVLCSTDENQLASDGEKNLHSPFAQAIVQLLETYKAAYINVGFFIDQVKSIAFEYNRYQVPLGGELIGSKHEHGQYVFRPSNTNSTSPEITDTEFTPISNSPEDSERNAAYFQGLVVGINKAFDLISIYEPKQLYTNHWDEMLKWKVFFNNLALTAINANDQRFNPDNLLYLVVGGWREIVEGIASYYEKGSSPVRNLHITILETQSHLRLLGSQYSKMI